MRFVRPMTMCLTLALLVLATGAIVSAEEEAEATPAASEEDAKLQARAQAYWEARVSRSPAVMEFYAPQEKLPEGVSGTHAEGGAVGWREFEIEAVKADGDEGLVQVRAGMQLASDFEVRIPDSMRDILKPTMMERWIRVEGEWYKRPIEPGLSRMMRRKREGAKRARAEASAKEAEATSPADD